MPRLTLLAALAVLSTVACGRSTDVGRLAAVERVAVAPLQSAPDADVRGSVVFVQTGDQVQLFAVVDGLSAGKHGIHVHEHGDCTPPTFDSAGGHFAPGGHAHGAPEDTEHHAGDFGNIVADDTGRAVMRMVLDDITLAPGDDRSLVDRALVVHAGEDDLRTQPSGNAGARVACGRIELVDAPSPAS